MLTRMTAPRVMIGIGVVGTTMMMAAAPAAAQRRSVLGVEGGLAATGEAEAASDAIDHAAYVGATLAFDRAPPAYPRSPAPRCAATWSRS